MKLLKDNRGFTIVEAVAASLIVAIGALLLFGGFMAAANLMDNGRALQQSGETTAAAINGGDADLTTITSRTIPELSCKTGGGYELIAENGTLECYTSNTNENVKYYRYIPAKR